MRKNSKKRSGRPENQPLTDEQIAGLTEQICSPGDVDTDIRASALLVLLDEIYRLAGDHKMVDVENVAFTVKQIAFSKLEGAQDAQVELLRGELNNIGGFTMFAKGASA